MKFDGQIVEILAVYDLTGSLRAIAELTICSHHTVARHVAARDAGQPIAGPRFRGRVTDPCLSKIVYCVEKSKGKIRAEKAHENLLALGYDGSERSTRRAVAQVCAAFRLGQVCFVNLKPAISALINRPLRHRFRPVEHGGLNGRFLGRQGCFMRASLTRGRTRRETGGAGHGEQYGR